MYPQYSVYILKCNDGKYYTGFTTNLKRRIAKHKNGEVRFTNSRLPLTIVHLSIFAEKIKAYNFERYLKSGSGVAFRNKHLV